MSEPVKIYAVRNNNGLWFRAKGRSGYKQSWVEKLEDARLYTKLGQARGRISYFANNFPQFPIPKLIEFSLSDMRVIDETARVNEIKNKKLAKKAMREAAIAKAQLSEAKQKLKRAQDEVARLEKK